MAGLCTGHAVVLICKLQSPLYPCCAHLQRYQHWWCALIGPARCAPSVRTAPWTHQGDECHSAISLAFRHCSFLSFLLLYHVLERPSAEPNRDSCNRAMQSGRFLRVLLGPFTLC